jgi:hypothetical protein
MIAPSEREVLAALNFNPAPTPDDVWQPSPFNVPELHERAVAEILGGVNRARRDDTARPLGVAVQGRAGSGKTHLLGAVREKIQHDGGFFFLVSQINGNTFWESTALGLVEGLAQPASVWGTQLKAFLRRLTPHLGLERDVRDVIAGDAPLTRGHLDTFIRSLRGYDSTVGRECQDTARALVLLGAEDFDAQDAGYAHLMSVETEPASRTAWGLSAAIRTPQLVVRDVSRLLALTLSPSVIAIDQLDTLFAQTSTSMFDRHDTVEESHAAVIGPVADGLLTLRDITRRTLVVVASLPDTWVLIKKCAPSPVVERFRETVLPDRIPTADIGRALIAKRFTSVFDAYGFVAPYPTWPVRPEAFEDATSLTPRQLLRRADVHVHHCIDQDEVTELSRLVSDSPVEHAPESSTVDSTDADLAPLDALYADLLASADVTAALDHRTEDAHMPALLGAGLAAWIDEQAPAGATFKHDPLPGTKPALHGRLIEVLDEATENEAHVGFRAIGSPNAVAVISRVKAACTLAGLDIRVPQRRLVLLRNGPWPTGPRTREVLAAFQAAGGEVQPISVEDLRVFAALRAMRTRGHAHLSEWLNTRRPASGTALFAGVLGGRTATVEVTEPPVVPVEVDAPATMPTPTHPGSTGPDGTTIHLGHSIVDNRPFVVNVESLRRHTVIFAGSGSGKTVLIRRLVEECSRSGVSAIVLDPNNDLARLGEAWPEPPSGWEPGDDERARDYLEHTDVVVWTPRITAGRPLAFQPLPDFAPVRDSTDEFDQAVHSAVEALAPRAGVTGTSRLAQQGKAVLTEALQAYARGGTVGLRGFTEFLADLPDGVSRMARAGKLAADVAETLKAAMVTDPLFGGVGAAADPGELLTPPPGKRSRVSVISFVGLSSDSQRQSFVNQLQMALFAWIKRHPAGDRPLGGLFVMDEAQTLAPSGGNTPCTASTVALASQARKYGLGLVFATQAPKGLHNQISGNATTQFFGLLNAPAQIDAARELAQAKGGRLPDIGLLGSGQFYAAGEGFSFVKVATPLCLSHHPKAPLSPEEVIDRARSGR